MDFRQSNQPVSRPAPVTNPGLPNSAAPKHPVAKKTSGSKWFKVLNVSVLIGIALLVAAVAVALSRGNSNNEFKYVNQKAYQAVFLNNGQVYFGNIDSLNSSYLRLTNIYYLTQSGDSSANSSSNYSLVKLGCQQIHDPTDQMLINRDQVTFWENLNDSGKVVSGITQFKKQNPNGPDCSQVSSQTQASSSGSATQGATK